MIVLFVLSLAIDPKWLIELAPKFYKRSDGKTISKEKKREKINPIFAKGADDDRFWRLSRRKGMYVNYVVCFPFNYDGEAISPKLSHFHYCSDNCR